MRIGFDAHVLDGRPQGTKTLMLNLIREAAAQYPEHEFYVYSYKAHPDLPFETSGNLHFRRIPDSSPTRRLIRSLPASKRRDQLDTMIYNFISSPNMRGSTVMIHDILPQTHSRYFKWSFIIRCYILFGLSALLSRHLFTISDHSASEIKRIYPWARGKQIAVLHIGPSFSPETYFATDAEHSAEGDIPYILCVGRIEPRKNVQIVIDAFSARPELRAKLVIVGKREPGIFVDLHGDERIVELGGVSDEELTTLYRGAALFIYPSIAEGFGLPLLDALLFGVPVISSRLTSMAEVGGDCVEFFDPTEANATETLSDRIGGHFDGRPVRPPTIEQRHERARLYSWSNAARELIDGICSREYRA